MIFRLIHLNGPHKGERITITREPMTLGRGPSCSICISEDDEIAEQHCTITHGPQDELSIHDNGSMNRILVNSHEVTDTKLKHGDTIEVGRTRLLVQAFVQAEVNRSGQPISQKKSSPVIPIIVILLIAGGVFFAVKQLRDRAEEEDQNIEEKEVIPPSLFKDIEATESEAPASPDLETAPTEPPEPATVTEPDTTPTEEPEPEPSDSEPAVASIPEPTQPEPEPPAPEVPSPIEVVSLSQQKFPVKAEYDEMRVVTLQLKTTGSVIDNSKVAVKFEFFDRDLTSGDIAPARAIVPVKALLVSQLAESGEETLTATYTVPKGLRNAPSANSGMTFYGVHVKVMYAGELVAEKALPRILLDRD